MTAFQIRLTLNALRCAKLKFPIDVFKAYQQTLRVKLAADRARYNSIFEIGGIPTQEMILKFQRVVSSDAS